MKKTVLFIMLFFLWAQMQAYGAGSYVFERSPQTETGLPSIAYHAADNLEYNITADLSRTLPIIAASFVDVNDFKTTSALGRMMGDLIGSRLAQHGYNVLEMRLRQEELHISAGGELALSRNIEHLKENWDAQAVLTGTYHLQNSRVIGSAKIISTVDNSIIAAHDFSFRLDNELQNMAEATRLDVDEYADRGKEEEHTGATEARPAALSGPLSTGSIELDPAKNTDAKLIQSRLADLGLYLDAIDGLWGRNSQIALEEFKKRHQLPDPEKWDLPTQIKLFQGAAQ